MPPGMKAALTGCVPRPRLTERSLLAIPQAAELAGVFKVLANDTRLRLLHALVRAGELSVTELADALGMKPQAVSNQLQRLADRGIVVPRRNGLQIHYRIVDPCVLSLLDRAWCLAEDAAARSAQPPKAGTAAFKSYRRK